MEIFIKNRENCLLKLKWNKEFKKYFALANLDTVGKKYNAKDIDTILSIVYFIDEDYKVKNYNGMYVVELSF